MEFAQAAKALGLRAIHGAEIDLDDGRHLTLLVETQRGLAQPLPDPHARARARRGSTHEPPPAVPLETLEEHAAGLVLPERLRAPRRARRADAAAAAGRLRARAPARRAAAAVPAPRPRAQPGAGRAGAGGSGCATVATGNVHAHARSRAPLQDAFVALRHHTTLDASEPRAARQHRPRARLARRRWRRASRTTRGAVAETRRAGRRGCASTSRRPRLPLPRRGGRRRRRASSPSCAGRGWTSATRRARRTTRGGARAAGGGAAGDRRARPRRLLPPAPRPAGARARGGGRGARAGLGARAAAAGARARLLGVLDRLLPHRPLAHRPDRERPVPRALPQRGAHRAAGHRPRLPARHPRGADPAHARPLRARSARRWWRRSRRSARAGRSASWARCSACRRGSSSGWRAGPSRGRSRRDGDVESAIGLEPAGRGAVHRSRLARAVRHEHAEWLAMVNGRGPTRRGARRRASPLRRCPAAGRGWRGCATRPTGCRATSPSTRAG